MTGLFFSGYTRAMLETLLACPRCDKTPLSEKDGAYRCSACKIDFPSIDGIPWMFADPQATLGEWRGRLQFALQKLSQESAQLEAELGDEDLRPLTRRRIERYKKATDSHRRSLQKCCNLWMYNRCTATTKVISRCAPDCLPTRR